MAQGVSMTVMVNIINTGLAGAILAPELWMATLPLSLQFVAVMLATLPASLLMARFGRQFRIFVWCGNFYSNRDSGPGDHYRPVCMFVMGAVLLGSRMVLPSSIATQQQTGCRVRKNQRRSVCATGGLAAALIGPEIAYRFVDVVEGARYAGAFIGQGSASSRLFWRVWTARNRRKVPMPGGTCLSFSRCPGSGLGGGGGAGLCGDALLMTATPLQIVNVSQLGVAENARVIQWHVTIMFAPSFTGHLIARFGIRQVMIRACYAMVYVFCGPAGTAFWDYFAALLLLGLGGFFCISQAVR